MANYFNSLPFRRQVEELAQCRFMDADEFDGGGGTQRQTHRHRRLRRPGLAPGAELARLRPRCSYALRTEAIAEKRQSWKNASEHGFLVGSYEELIPRG